MNQFWIGMLVVIGGGIILALAIWGIMLFVQQDKKYQKQQDTILQNGICVLGSIIKHQDTFSAGKNLPHTYYHVMYSYEYKGKTYTQEQEVTKEIYLASPDEIQVNVHFLPDDPTQVVTTFDEGIR